jgi:hypothetical protein
MNLKVIVVSSIIFIILLFGLMIVGSAVSNYNSFVKLEEQVEAIHKDMENAHGSIYNQIKSQGLTVQNYGDTVIKAINVAISGRYGEGGVKSAWTWIQEKNPEIDPSLYKSLMQVIEAGYNKFENIQRNKIDVVRTYNTKLRTFPDNIWANIFGFPKCNLKDLEEVISTESSKEMMETKKMDTINPFGEEK